MAGVTVPSPNSRQVPKMMMAGMSATRPTVFGFFSFMSSIASIGEAAALALVVRAGDEAQVLEAHDQRDVAGEHQRQQAEDVGPAGLHRVRPVDALLQGVERACADVPVDDAEGGEGERADGAFTATETLAVWLGR